MSNSKTAQDVELLKSDIASFASSLGFSADSSLPYSGFNDVDFRKAGPLKPPKPPKTPKQNSQLEKKPSNNQTPKTDKNTKNNQRPKPNKPPVLSLDDSNKSNRFSRDPDKFKNFPALPLVKASALSLWYEDESELEKKLFGEEGKGKKAVNVRNVEELKRLVEKKMELGERLMWQYAKDYELSKGKSGDMKMVLASQRSGTAADKVSAFSFVVADNPVANLKSLDGLLGLVTSKVGKRYAFTGFEALKELFISKLLPDRKLKTLIQRPVDELPETKDGYSLLLFWYWEDCLKQSLPALVNNRRCEKKLTALSVQNDHVCTAKEQTRARTQASIFASKQNNDITDMNHGSCTCGRCEDFRYERFVVALEEASRDMLPALKDKALKLGDPQNKGASNADYYLSNLLSDHPNMKVHSKNFNVGVQALMLLDKISSKNQAEMFIGLLLRAMKSDVNLKRVSAFSKRILQVALQQPPQYACGCLFLISEVLKARPQLWNMMLQNESVDEDLEHFEDIVEETASEPSLASKKEENNHDICGGEAANSDSYSSEDEGVLPSSYSDDDISEDEKELFIRETPKDQHHQEPKIISNQNALTSPKSTAKPFFPGGYDPRHREPSYSNADRASWWELMVLSTHVHPSVATMAATLLSGANIVYNGNPLNDLSLTAFLDKFMEKKPKASSWHGGSQIEPAKKVSFIFSNDNEEIENILDSANPSLDADGDYDYDDLDNVANEDDDDLIGDASDAEMDIPSDDTDGEGFDVDAGTDSINDDGDDAIAIGDADDLSDGEDEFHQRKRKRKPGKKTSASPFASLEDYEHLLNEDSPTEKDSIKMKKFKPRKKKLSK
ncbi:hypothetical protein GOBAR_AA05528 [Gossypium barbadense]|uniref:CCAAT-binding factor domain-containing protein n=1 Tax=Gossypium barbadense TaxID=3634 RepID=A0A2P5YHH2_GOSBA|nr:hypothetical protein GOBAR_AA05528 [Gossypium barbadense]